METLIKKTFDPELAKKNISRFILYGIVLKCEYCEELFSPADCEILPDKISPPLHGCSFQLDQGFEEDRAPAVPVRKDDPILLRKKVRPSPPPPALRPLEEIPLPYPKHARCEHPGHDPAKERLCHSFCVSCDRFLCEDCASKHPKNH